MFRHILNGIEVESLVRSNRYRVSSEHRFLSRCIDGRYENADDLPALAFPGADVGDFAVVMATANDYGFTIDIDKAFLSFLKTIGGVEHFRYHSDLHHGQTYPASGCGHWKQINMSPEAYRLKKDQIDFINHNLNTMKKNGIKENLLKGEHMEGAVLQLTGDYGIKPRFIIETDEGKVETAVFVYQRTLTDERHRLLARNLLEDKAVRLFEGCGEDYLYQALSDITDNHLLETIGRLAKNLPVFRIAFDNKGDFKIINL
ncbi:hypothetical protein GYA28_02015 [Candidatus Roizmanbacteria bacterium]|jgi:hypothetical protein|nr:hypothetical protein [Candidatus Roizmanbacteria bacterium]